MILKSLSLDYWSTGLIWKIISAQLSKKFPLSKSLSYTRTYIYCNVCPFLNDFSLINLDLFLSDVVHGGNFISASYPSVVLYETEFKDTSLK